MSTGWNSRLAWSGYVLGIALGGFFDGILLHQVLQWHHLLSLVPGQSLGSLSAQVFADGLFHVLMYGVALVGLWLLWGARDQVAAPSTSGKLAFATLLGFALWNFIDVVGFHWIAGIHRIRVDVPQGQRLFWDLAWLALFGVLPLCAAYFVRGSSSGLRPGPLGILVIAAVGLSFRTPPDSAAGRLVLFRAHMTSPQIFQAIAALDGRVLWTADGGRLVGVELPAGSSSWSLYRRGAVLVSGPGSLSGCLNWAKPGEGAFWL